MSICPIHIPAHIPVYVCIKLGDNLNYTIVLTSYILIKPSMDAPFIHELMYFIIGYTLHCSVYIVLTLIVWCTLQLPTLNKFRISEGGIRKPENPSWCLCVHAHACVCT